MELRPVNQLRIIPIVAFVTVNVMSCAQFAIGSIWINELHYDNIGGDVGEFVEVVVGPDMSGVNLSDIALTLYNGSNGSVYDTHTLDTFMTGSLDNGFQFFSISIPGIQNGAPDGLALDLSGTLIEFISYEGSFTGVGGIAAGVTSTDIGVAESSATPIDFSLGLTGGPGSMASDFMWVGPMSGSRGAPNPGQSFVQSGGAVPEPGSASIWVIVVCSLFIALRKRIVSGVRAGNC